MVIRLSPARQSLGNIRALDIWRPDGIDRLARTVRHGVFAYWQQVRKLVSMQRIPIRPAISMYLGIGIFLTSIRFMSLFAWAGWHLLFPAVDMNGNSISYLGTCIVALKGTALMLVGWPIYIYWAIKGPATWGAVFFYPWFALAR